MAATKITMEQLRDELINEKSLREISVKYSISDRTLRRKKAQLKSTGFDPDNGRYHKNPDSQVVKGYSTLVKFGENDPFGRVLEWVKTNVKVSDQLGAIEKVLDSLAEEIQPVKAVKYLGHKRPSKDKITVIPIGDPHIGLMTWKNEVGEDWDLKIAQRVYAKVFQRLLEDCRDTEECILINTGDFFHADNIEGQTSRSRHKLDLDGRHGKWLDVGGILLCLFIDSCLKKFKKVTFVNVAGNHDDILGRFLGTLATCTYRNEKRLKVLKGDKARQYQKRGKVGMGFAHSHLCKPKQLPQSFAVDQPEIWGSTTLRIFFTGHIHHDSETIYKDNNGVIVVSAGIIPPRDSYSYGAGYSAHRTIQAYLLDTKNAEMCTRASATVRGTD